MRLIKKSSGTKLVISKKEWEEIGKKYANILKQSKTQDTYVIDRDPKSGKIKLYYGDIGSEKEGDEVFDMKMLLKTFNAFKDLGLKELPEYRTAKEWNNFLDNLERSSKIQFGRVIDDNELKDVKNRLREEHYSTDPKKQRQKEKIEGYEERNKSLQHGVIPK